MRQLRREAQGREQRPEEPFTKYATSLMTMMRRAGGFSTQEQLDQLYENADLEYQLYIRRDEIHSVTELQPRCQH